MAAHAFSRVIGVAFPRFIAAFEWELATLEDLADDAPRRLRQATRRYP